jgi:putative phosphoserine phosphatase/1-acylglycerol-3-phosphate O-acyltransferase
VIAALFDFDGTLYTGHVWQDLVRHHWHARRHRRWVLAYVLRNMAPLPIFRLGLMDQATFFGTWGRTMAWLLRGWTADEAYALFERLTEKQVIPNLRPDVLEHVRRHQAEGHLVALVSGTFSCLLEVIAQRLDIEHAVGTPLEIKDGRYTGRIIPPLCQGEGKPRRTRAYLADRGLEVDWAVSFAYADRSADLSLLQQVGQAVAVYPDESLFAHAQAQGWAVIGEVSR